MAPKNSRMFYTTDSGVPPTRKQPLFSPPLVSFSATPFYFSPFCFLDLNHRAKRVRARAIELASTSITCRLSHLHTFHKRQRPTKPPPLSPPDISTMQAVFSWVLLTIQPIAAYYVPESPNNVEPTSTVVAVNHLLGYSPRITDGPILNLRDTVDFDEKRANTCGWNIDGA